MKVYLSIIRGELKKIVNPTWQSRRPRTFDERCRYFCSIFNIFTFLVNCFNLTLIKWDQEILKNCMNTNKEIKKIMTSFGRQIWLILLFCILECVNIIQYHICTWLSLIGVLVYWSSEIIIKKHLLSGIFKRDYIVGANPE